MNEIPATIGRYRLRDSLGRGGDAPLYLATDPANQAVVIRLFPENNEALQRRIIREALPAIRIRHPHIIKTLELSGDNGRPFVVSEYFAGRTLADLIDEAKPLPVSRALGLIEQLCSALAFARARHLLRRELRPDDVVVNGEGVLKIVDFGLSRPLEPEAARPASPEFVAPEQIHGAAPDARSDVYTVGTLLFNLLTPRQSADPDRTVIVAPARDRALAPETSGPEVDVEVRRIVTRCLEREPEQRYPDAEALACELRQVSARLCDPAANGGADDPQTVDVAVADPDRTRVMPAGDGRRRAVDGDDLTRRAAQVAPLLEAATRAMDAGDYDSAIAAGEEAMVRDADNAAALAIVDRARTLLGAREAAALLKRAEGELASNDPDAALALVERAAGCGAAGDDVVRLRDTCARALRERDVARQREALLIAELERAHQQFENGALHDALATLDDLQLIPAPDLSEAHRADAELLRRSIGDAFAAEAREVRRQFVAGEVMRVRAEIDRDEYRQALDRLAALEQEGDGSPEIVELRIVAEEGLAENELLAARARALSQHVGAAASLFAQNDLQGSLGRVQAALALAPAHEPALALRGMIENRVLELGEQQRAIERQARQIAAAAAPAKPRPDRNEVFAREQGPDDEVVAAGDETVIVLPSPRSIRARFLDESEGPEVFLSEESSLAATGAAAPPVESASPAAPVRANAPLDLPLQNQPAAIAGAASLLLAQGPHAPEAPAAPADEPPSRDAAAAVPDVSLSSPGQPPRSYALYGAIGAVAAALIGFAAWTLVTRPPAPVPEPPPALSASAAPAQTEPVPEPVAAPPPPPAQTAAPPAPRPAAPAAPPTTIAPSSETRATPPAAVPAPPAEPAPAPREADANLARRLEGLRDTARRQLARAENQQGLTTIAAGLELAPGDPVLRPMLEEALDAARDAAAQARSAALAVTPAAANLTTYREADLRVRDAAHSAQNGSPIEAVRAYWLAEALFIRAESEAQLQSPPSAAPAAPAAPAAATRPPEEPRGAVGQPSSAAVPPAPRSAAAVAGASGPAASRAMPPSDEPAIRTVLRSYAAAYSGLDAGAVQRVFPSVNEPALRRAFSGLRSQQVEIQDEQLAINGETASVSCMLVTLAIGQVGAATPRRDARRVVFTLARRDGTWVIVDRR